MIECFGIMYIGMVLSMIEVILIKLFFEFFLKYIIFGGEKINDNVL